MNPGPNDIVILDAEETDDVVAIRGVWMSPVGVGRTESQAIRALRELCERAPECHHCGPVTGVEHYSGERFGRPFEDRPLCIDCVSMLYETEPEASIGEPERSVETVPVEQRRAENHRLQEWSETV